jgi:hypothetical protein
MQELSCEFFLPSETEENFVHLVELIQIDEPGRPSWKYSINLHSILDEGEGLLSASDAVIITRKIASQFRLLPKKFFDANSAEYDPKFIKMVNNFEVVTEQILLNYSKSKGCQPADIIYAWMDQVYSFCDKARIWTRD